jgi:hypothetical protein
VQDKNWWVGSSQGREKNLWIAYGSLIIFKENVIRNVISILNEYFSKELFDSLVLERTS